MLSSCLNCAKPRSLDPFDFSAENTMSTPPSKGDRQPNARIVHRAACSVCNRGGNGSRANCDTCNALCHSACLSNVQSSSDDNDLGPVRECPKCFNRNRHNSSSSNCSSSSSNNNNNSSSSSDRAACSVCKKGGNGPRANCDTCHAQCHSACLVDVEGSLSDVEDDSSGARECTKCNSNRRGRRRITSSTHSDTDNGSAVTPRPTEAPAEKPALASVFLSNLKSVFVFFALAFCTINLRVQC